MNLSQERNTAGFLVNSPAPERHLHCQLRRQPRERTTEPATPQPGPSNTGFQRKVIIFLQERVGSPDGVQFSHCTRWQVGSLGSALGQPATIAVYTSLLHFALESHLYLKGHGILTACFTFSHLVLQLQLLLLFSQAAAS